MAIKFTQVTDHTNQRIINVGSPSVGTDAVTKDYVDSVAQGLDWKASVRAASTGDINLAAPGATLDGVALANGDRFLAKDQAAGEENGIYTFNGAAAAATRSTDSDTGAKLTAGAAVSVEAGTVNKNKTYILITSGFTLDTDPINFTLMNGGSFTYTGGNGIDITSGVVTAVPASGGGLTVGAGGIAVDNAVVVKKFASNVGDGSSTSIGVAHNLNTRDVVVEVYTNAAPYDTVFCEVQRTDVNNVALVFGSAPAAAAYRVVVHG